MLCRCANGQLQPHFTFMHQQTFSCFWWAVS